MKCFVFDHENIVWVIASLNSTSHVITISLVFLSFFIRPKASDNEAWRPAICGWRIVIINVSIGPKLIREAKIDFFVVVCFLRFVAFERHPKKKSWGSNKVVCVHNLITVFCPTQWHFMLHFFTLSLHKALFYWRQFGRLRVGKRRKEVAGMEVKLNFLVCVLVFELFLGELSLLTKTMMWWWKGREKFWVLNKQKEGEKVLRNPFVLWVLCNRMETSLFYLYLALLRV